MNWKEKKLATEIQVKESIRDVQFLHDSKMFAVREQDLPPLIKLSLSLQVAQKKYVYVYDDQGIELHKLKNHLEPSHLEYLPFHFLLVSASRLGFIKYHDISTGSIVAGKNQPTPFTSSLINFPSQSTALPSANLFA